MQVATAIRGAIIQAKMSVVPVRRGYWGNKIGKPHTVPTKVGSPALPSPLTVISLSPDALTPIRAHARDSVWHVKDAFLTRVQEGAPCVTSGKANASLHRAALCRGPSTCQRFIDQGPDAFWSLLCAMTPVSSLHGTCR